MRGKSGKEPILLWGNYPITASRAGSSRIGRGPWGIPPTPGWLTYPIDGASGACYALFRSVFSVDKQEEALMNGFEATLLVTLLLLLRLAVPVVATFLFCRAINCFRDRYGVAAQA